MPTHLIDTVTDISSQSWIIDEDNMASDDATKVPTQQSVKAYVDSVSAGNVVIVEAEGDLPTPSGGIITLDASKEYRVSGSATLTNKIDLNGTTIYGIYPLQDKLIYSPSTGELFTGANGGQISNLTLTAANGTALLFNLDDTVGDKQLNIRFCTISGCVDVGLIKGYNFAQFQLCTFAANSAGIEFENCNIANSFASAWLSNNSSTYETYTGTFDIIGIIAGVRWALVANSAVGTDITGVTTISNKAIIEGTSYVGDGTHLNGTPNNTWEIKGPGVTTYSDDVADGSCYISTPIETAIGVVDTPVKVLGTTTTSNLFRFDDDGGTSNRLRYVGNKSRKFTVNASISFTTAGNNKIISFYIYKYDNSGASGAVEVSSRSQRKVSTGADVGAMSVSAVVELDANDYIELWGENNTDNTNFTVQFSNIIVS